MKRVKTSKLTGAALDWAVAKCEGYECLFDDEVSGAWLVPQQGYLHDEKPLSKFGPSTDWKQGGPIIERECMQLWKDDCSKDWLAAPFGADDSERDYDAGPTPLIAAMRCFVASELGDEVEIPEELLCKS